MNIDVVKLQARAQVIETWVAAMRKAMPTNPDPTTKVFFDLIYGTAEAVSAGVELLADVAHEVDRATKGTDPPADETE